MKKVKIAGLSTLALFLIVISGYFIVTKTTFFEPETTDEAVLTERAKRALQNHPMMKAKYAPNESHIIGAGYSTIVCNFQVNGISVLFPRHVIQDNFRGRINGRTDNYAPEGEFFSDYGKNRLTVGAVAPIHYPKDGTYFFCEGSALEENIHLNISAKKDPLAYSGQSSTQVIVASSEGRQKPEIDYNDIEWVVYKSKGNRDDLEITHKTTTSFEEGILPDISVTTHYFLEKPKGNLPSPIFWRDAEPFEETPENMALLWEAYEEIIAAFESQKQSEVIKALDIALIQSELIIGNPKDLMFTNDRLYKYQVNWDKHGFKHSNYNKLEDYELRMADHQKLFRLVLKKDERFSPVHFSLKGKDESFNIYEFHFMMFKGKPKVAFIERKVNVF